MTRTSADPAGRFAIVELLRLQDEAAPRSRFAALIGLSPLTTASRPWFDAAVGEIAVGEALSTLGDGWFVLHALPVGVQGSHVDHVDHIAIGRRGVFIINTTNHAGQAVWASQRAFVVSGIRHPFIRNMEYAMGRAERILGTAAGVPVQVNGILAVAAAKSITVRDTHRDVTVLSIESLVQWLGTRPVALTAEEAGAVARAAALESTWHTVGDPVGDRALLLGRFASLRRDVRRAGRLRATWAAVLALLGAGAFAAVAYSILASAPAAL